MASGLIKIIGNVYKNSLDHYPNNAESCDKEKLLHWLAKH